MGNFNYQQYLKEGKLLKEEINYQISGDVVEINGEEYYNNNGVINISLGFDYNSDNPTKYTKDNWTQKLNPKYDIVQIFNLIPSAKVSYKENSEGGLAEITLLVTLNDIKKYLTPHLGSRGIEEGGVKNDYINNHYVVKDDEDDYYFINPQKAEQYLSQFDSDEINAEGFIDDNEGFNGEDLSGIMDVETLSNDEIEGALKQAMSYYFFSDPDSI